MPLGTTGDFGRLTAAVVGAVGVAPEKPVWKFAGIRKMIVVEEKKKEE